MTFGHKATRTHRLAIVTLGAALAVSGALVSSPASAQFRPGTTASADCIRDGGVAARGTGRRPDTEQVPAAVARQVQREIAETASAYRISSSRTGARTTAAGPAINVPVWIHVIRGKHRGDRVIGRPAAAKMFAQLKYGFNGGQNPAMAASGITFLLRGIDFRSNDRWFHSAPMSAADREMKRDLHRGNGWALNIYVKGISSSFGTLLGYSRFPWQYRANRLLDGVTVNVDSLSGGRLRGYNYGDTVIHETGHWFGLLHTFEGFPDGCSGIGDGVGDTPAEAIPAAGCPLGRDTCDAAGTDPVTNFMDYGFDSCMNTFTPGQQARMKAAFLRYRYNVR
ncbi:MAG: zinc metalloprotease [Nocardioidaceae bacterium]|nr:zinc metalloprotease [Nocardioidaceae bacterium]